MAVKSILCIFGGLKSELNAVNTALILGKAYDARIKFLHISPDPNSYIAAYGDTAIASTPLVIEEIEKENAALAQRAKHSVISIAAKHHIPLDLPHKNHVSAQFTHLTGYLERVIAREGRLNDLIVIGQSEHSDSSVIAALFNTGRPVLVMPIENEPLPSTFEDKIVVLAWDGGLEAARTILNAMPLIAKAEKVHLLIVRVHSKAFDLEAEKGTIEYLNAHGFDVDAIVVDRGDHPIGKVILTEAHRLNADILVMGAYGHSRFREMILGGVTNYMLEKADLPLLLSH